MSAVDPLTHPGPVLITLVDGREVLSDAEEWRAECAQRDRHVKTLMSLPDRQARANYLSNVSLNEGNEAAERVKARFLVEWQGREGQ